jgi:hypothetical protein
VAAQGARPGHADARRCAGRIESTGDRFADDACELLARRAGVGLALRFPERLSVPHQREFDRRSADVDSQRIHVSSVEHSGSNGADQSVPRAAVDEQLDRLVSLIVQIDDAAAGVFDAEL